MMSARNVEARVGASSTAAWSMGRRALNVEGLRVRPPTAAWNVAGPGETRQSRRGAWTVCADVEGPAWAPAERRVEHGALCAERSAFTA
jgi:hypothetical protein